MTYQIISIFNRSVILERINASRFETEDECTVCVNGKEYVRTNKNVISINGLEPSHRYSISLYNADGSHAGDTKVTTGEESFLLNVRSFGAAGDGAKNDTNAIQAAIMSCPINGTVYVPEGTYFTGPLFLKSHMTLWIDKAILTGHIILCFPA